MQRKPYFETDKGQLYLGDCLEVMPEIQAGSIDMILCDLPYGTTDCKWDKRIDLTRLWAEYWRVAKPSAAIVLTAQQPFATDLINAARKWFRYEIIWEKNLALGFLSANKKPLRAHENILVFYRSLPTYNPQMVWGKPYVSKNPPNNITKIYCVKRSAYAYNEGTRYPRSVQRWAQEGRRTEHPTEKPQAMFEWLIQTYTNADEVVLDNCIGSGTTAAACESVGRWWIGIEMSEDFCKVMRERLEGRPFRCNAGVGCMEEVQMRLPLEADGSDVIDVKEAYP
jgi:site-specific DNA-methyltransferase (adenine-specific)